MNIYEDSKKKGYLDVSNDGVLKRDIIKTLRDPDYKKYVEEVFKGLRK